jgi:arylformamidase
MARYRMPPRRIVIHDISPPVSPELAVWPGDAPLSREVLLDIARGDPVTLSAIRATVHLGAHADAPGHVARGAPSIGERGLDDYIGACQVVRVAVGRGEPIVPEHITAAIEAPRVLLATGTYPDARRFNEDFAAPGYELIEHLAARGVRLIGIDTPSIDLFRAEDLPSHRKCIERGIAILEGLVLDGVPEGIYELIALPLKLMGFDGSPVRAVLRPLL